MLSTVKQKTVVFSSSKKHGFTLVEIIVACAVVIALFAGAVFIGHNLLENGKYNKAKTDIATIDTAVRQYFFDTGNPVDNLETLTKKNGEYGPWLDTDMLKDPWDQDYFYTYYGSGIYYVLSYGSNKELDSNPSNTPDCVSGDDIGICSIYSGQNIIRYSDGKEILYNK